MLKLQRLVILKSIVLILGVLYIAKDTFHQTDSSLRNERQNSQTVEKDTLQIRKYALLKKNSRKCSSKKVTVVQRIQQNRPKPDYQKLWMSIQWPSNYQVTLRLLDNIKRLKCLKPYDLV